MKRVSAGSPYVIASSSAGYKGYNYQNRSRITRNRPSKGNARSDASRLIGTRGAE
jgi:hypothetical protein